MSDVQPEVDPLLLFRARPDLLQLRFKFCEGRFPRIVFPAGRIEERGLIHEHPKEINFHDFAEVEDEEVERLFVHLSFDPPFRQLKKESFVPFVHYRITREQAYPVWDLIFRPSFGFCLFYSCIKFLLVRYG